VIIGDEVGKIYGDRTDDESRGFPPSPTIWLGKFTKECVIPYSAESRKAWRLKRMAGDALSVRRTNER
jgi:hypothetical protein